MKVPWARSSISRSLNEEFIVNAFGRPGDFHDRSLPMFALFFADLAELIEPRTLLAALNFFFLTINCKTVARGLVRYREFNRDDEDLSAISASRLKASSL